ncbi:hypothetical protein [Actinomadura rubrisoli]|uniref:Uncharacterized protein n=1 Tax=Actinomadura rubrisoli TaxID=2530368 RepID=A0A4R5CGN6_9ACTN|nr:hypothetical protein [Actinomadura rubrisoli]TDD97640.1 hypothetical protein E1298_00995 [Actinomadura rubrisoli]
MSALASQADIERRLGRGLTAPEAARVAALLDDASALVRAYTGQAFELVEDDEVVLRASGGAIVLPQRPVSAVSSVVAVGGSEALPDFTVVDWMFDEIDTIRIGEGACVINLPEVWWDDDGYPGTYRVTYSHGYAAVPGDVLSVVCGVLMRSFGNPQGLRSETVGSYSITYAVPATGEALGLNLTRYEQRALDRYRRKAATIRVTR